MTIWSATERRKAEVEWHMEQARSHGRPIIDKGIMAEWTPMPPPEPGTGTLTISSRLPEWVNHLTYIDRRSIPAELKRRVWSAVWAADDGPEIVECPVDHHAGVLEWAARQRPVKVEYSVPGSYRDDADYELPPPVGRPPDPGCGILRIWFESNHPAWRAVWFDIYAGLTEFFHDDLREMIKWADDQPAEEKYFAGDQVPDDEIDLETFKANPDLYLRMWE